MSHQLINQTSGDTEYYTDPLIVGAARLTMGGIDLDSASSVRANRIVMARFIYTKENDGLQYPWCGRIWLNHPFHRGESVCEPGCKKKICQKRGCHCDKAIPSNSNWIDHLIENFADQSIQQFCCITYAATSEAWFQPLLEFPQCFLSPRTNYYLPDGSIKRGVTKGSVVTYGGSNVDAFAKYFKQFGKVK